MRRRDFLTGIVVSSTVPLAARAQQPGKVPRIGFLGAASPSTFAPRLEAFRLGLRDFGYIEGVNITIEYRWAEGRYERFPKLAAELVSSNVDLIVTPSVTGSPISVVANVARPGGNITGQSFFGSELRAAMTIGIVVVARLAARHPGVVCARLPQSEWLQFDVERPRSRLHHLKLRLGCRVGRVENDGCLGEARHQLFEQLD